MRKFAVILGCTIALALTGCTQSHIVSGGEYNDKPNFETKTDVALDWGQIGEDVDDYFTEDNGYPLIDSVGYSVDPNFKLMELNVMVHPEATKEDAKRIAMEVIKGFNDVVADQDFSLEKSSDTSFGGFFKKYAVDITVVPAGISEMVDGKSWYLSATVKRGEYMDFTQMSEDEIAQATTSPDETKEAAEAAESSAAAAAAANK